MSPCCSPPRTAPPPRDSSAISGHWRFRLKPPRPSATLTHYLVAGDGNQMSVVEAWAPTPAGLQDPPRRTDGSVDANRLRQYEWHCMFRGGRRETGSRAQV